MISKPRRNSKYMKKHLSIRSVMAALLGLSLLVPALALADSGLDAAVGTAVSASAGANTGATTGTTATNASASVTLSATVTARAKTKADTEITRRITALTALNTRVQAMTKVTAQFQANLAASIQTQITNLTTLKAKIDADTDGATLKADVQSVTGSYRVYALILPQARIAAAADREATIANMLAGLGSKLQARIQAAQTAGADITTIDAALVDMAAQIQTGQASAQAAVTATGTLTPDNGDKTLMAANNAALGTGRADIKTAQTDLTAARKDVDTILKGLHTIEASAAASSTVQTQ